MSVLARLGLDRRELRAWAAYDWANSAFITVVVSAVFPIFYVKVAGQPMLESEASRRFTIATTIALAIAALLAPILGAIADRAPVKKRFLLGFSILGVAATATMATIEQGDWLWALVLFGVANIAANGAFVFYDALLPHVARPHEIDRVSTAGYALGYLGGGLLLATLGAFGLKSTGAVHVAFLVTAAWWAIFAIPIFRVVREPALPPERRASGFAAVRAAFRDLRATYNELRRFPQAALMLVAFLVYNDGIGTIYRVATLYGAELGLEARSLITALVIVQFVGIPATFLFGAIAGVIGTRRAILAGLAVYVVVSIYGYFLDSTTDFFVLAVLVGLVQGGTQALSRSLFASMIPRDRSSEFFGLFAVFEKFAGIAGPAIFALAQTAFGSSRPAILSIIAFFIVGGFLLTRVDVDAGRAAALAANK
ncbi:MAG: MFS transporter [Kofleriaceae bacterium]|nr:MAG: MFS transporter [Kofleriaceae bacterium]MBZ0235830.1 MFS transporter [Kofleriaceae bacterium]